MTPHILIADSGSTKTDWALGTYQFSTQGMNPFHQNDDQLLSILHTELLPQLSALPCFQGQPVVAAGILSQVAFYGSGVTPTQQPRMEQLLRQVLGPSVCVQASSDLLGAARALCGGREGLACILGTGANSCLYDGHRIVANTPALGYILGDEGSGAVLGRLLVNAIYKEGLYAGAREDFERFTGMTMAQVTDRVYRQPLANRWLASLSPFVSQQLARPSVQALVVQNFRDFIRRNLNPYARHDLPLSAVGSIAFHYQEQLLQAAREEGYRLGTVLRSPLDGLRRYHAMAGA